MMINTAVADSSYLIANFDAGDVFHSKAVSLQPRLSRFSLVFFDCVINEVLSVLCRRAEEKKRSKEIVKSIELIERTIPPSSIVWSYNDVESAYADIVALMKQHCGKLNFHDCLIALSAREHGIGRIISFDADFDDIDWLERIC